VVLGFYMAVNRMCKNWEKSNYWLLTSTNVRKTAQTVYNTHGNPSELRQMALTVEQNLRSAPLHTPDKHLICCWWCGPCNCSGAHSVQNATGRVWYGLTEAADFGEISGGEAPKTLLGTKFVFASMTNHLRMVWFSTQFMLFISY